MAGRGVTPMTAALRRTLAAHGVAERTGIPVEEVLAGDTASAAVGPSRRDVLKAAGAVVAGATLGGTLPARRANAAMNPSVLVVGAGLAGLRAAHYLWRVKGIAAAVYEGNSRAGGRCYSLRDYFPGLVVEHGGQLVNTDHNAFRNLTSSWGSRSTPCTAEATAGWSTSTGSTARTTPTTPRTPTGARSTPRCVAPSGRRPTRRRSTPTRAPASRWTT